MVDIIQAGNIGLMNAVRSFAERPIGNFPAHSAALHRGRNREGFRQSEKVKPESD